MILDVFAVLTIFPVVTLKGKLKLNTGERPITLLKQLKKIHGNLYIHMEKINEA